MSDKYTKCIESFCNGELEFDTKRIKFVTSMCTKSSKSRLISSRNFNNEFIPLLVYSHFDDKNITYRMKHKSELENGYDAIDITRDRLIQIKCLYDKKFWGRLGNSFDPDVDIHKILYATRSIAYGVVRKHLHTYTKTHLLVHLPIPRDSLKDTHVEMILSECIKVLSKLAKNGNSITVTSKKGYAGTRTKLYLKRLGSSETHIRLI